MSSKNYGLPVSDARRDLVLHISEKDIRGGKPSDNDYCVIANALCRQEHFKAARVFKTMTYVYKKDGSVERFVTPDSLYIELIVHDRGGKFQVGEYVLRAPKGSKRLGHHEKPKGKGNGRKTGKLPKEVHLVKAVREDAPKGIKSLKSLFGEE